MKFQLIAVEYIGLQFTKGIFNPTLIFSKFVDFADHEK